MMRVVPGISVLVPRPEPPAPMSTSRTRGYLVLLPYSTRPTVPKWKSPDSHHTPPAFCDASRTFVRCALHAGFAQRSVGARHWLIPSGNRPIGHELRIILNTAFELARPLHSQSTCASDMY